MKYVGYVAGGFVVLVLLISLVSSVVSRTG
jgi:hypothetical protein